MAFIAVSYGLDETSKYEEQAKQKYEHYASQAYGPERDACFKLSLLSQRNCIAEAERKAREYERGEQDLVAQRVTAIWTSIMGTAAVVGILFSLLGVYLVFTTFQATKAGNKITEDVGQAQARAYLLFGSAEYSRDGDLLRCRFTIENNGSTPALYVRPQVHFVIVRYDEEGEILVSDMSPHGKANCADTVPPDTPTDASVTWNLSQIELDDEIRNRIDQGEDFAFGCTIYWKDVFDKINFVNARLLPPKRKRTASSVIAMGGTLHPTLLNSHFGVPARYTPYET
ncbi:MAG: hypothetical protein LCH46_16165 [Proteobacteria bacterium]|nr:hypothetical protein [Pseudomonadota bacterium]